MANLSQIKREQMIAFLEKLKEQHNDDESLIAFNQIEKELTSKKYGLVWEEHEENVDVMMKTHIPVFTEVKEKEIVENPESERFNFLLEGDNLHSLKLLEKTHKGKVDIIYIDPPYNTGNKDFVYDDTVIDANDGYSHSKWLSFISSRLQLSRELLSKHGVIFVSIDDREYANLKLLMDEIFGANNCVSTLVWEKKKKGSFLSNSITNIKEYVLVYCKDMTMFNGLIGEINESTETYPCINASNKREVRHIKAGIKSNYKEKNFVLPAGTVVSNNTMNIVYLTDLVIKDGVVEKDFEVEGNWRYADAIMEEYSEKQELYITNELYIRRIVSTPRYKTLKDVLPRVGTNEDGMYADAIDHKNLFASGWGSNEDADNELIDFFGKQRVFSYPKPSKLIKKLIVSTRIKDALILDFFAGSGTTAQAVLELNKEDGENRTFILCTNNENNICEDITYYRAKTVITGKKKDGSEYSHGIAANMKYYKTGFVCKDSDDLYEELLAHTKEMIQLQYGVRVDGKKYVMIMDDDEMDEFEKKIEDYSDLQAVFINQDVLLSTSQEKLLSDVNTYIIPDCYFDFELREAGELW